MCEGWVGIFLHKDILRAADIAEHVHHVLVLRLAVGRAPLFLVEGISSALHHFACRLVGFREIPPRSRGCLVAVESYDPYACLRADSGKTAGDGVVVLGDGTCVEHCLGLERQRRILVRKSLQRGGFRKQLGGRVEILADLIPGLFL